MTDVIGNVTQALDYYPYGGQRINTGTSTSSDRQYIGERYDNSTQLNYLNARYYDGARGGFLSQDPVFWEVGQTRDGNKALSDPQLQNSYSYSRNNPVLLADKDGRFLPLLILAVEVYGAFNFGYSAGELLNSQVLFKESYSPQQKADAKFSFGFNVLTEIAGPELKPFEKAFVTVAPDLLSQIEKIGEAPENRKKRNEINGYNNKGDEFGLNNQSGSGSYNYTSAQNNFDRYNQSSSHIGGQNFSVTQQGALENFIKEVNSGNTNTQTYFSALQSVVSAFSKK